MGNILASHQLGDVVHSDVVFHLRVQQHAVVQHDVRLLNVDVHLHVACTLNGALSAQWKYARCACMVHSVCSASANAPFNTSPCTLNGALSAQWKYARCA